MGRNYAPMRPNISPRPIVAPTARPPESFHGYQPQQSPARPQPPPAAYHSCQGDDIVHVPMKPYTSRCARDSVSPHPDTLIHHITNISQTPPAITHVATPTSSKDSQNSRRIVSCPFT